jgi:hypothetical protein
MKVKVKERLVRLWCTWLIGPEMGLDYCREVEVRHEHVMSMRWYYFRILRVLWLDGWIWVEFRTYQRTF